MLIAYARQTTTAIYALSIVDAAVFAFVKPVCRASPTVFVYAVCTQIFVALRRFFEVFHARSRPTTSYPPIQYAGTSTFVCTRALGRVYTRIIKWRQTDFERFNRRTVFFTAGFFLPSVRLFLSLVDNPGTTNLLPAVAAVRLLHGQCIIPPFPRKSDSRRFGPWVVGTPRNNNKNNRPAVRAAARVIYFSFFFFVFCGLFYNIYVITLWYVCGVHTILYSTRTCAAFVWHRHGLVDLRTWRVAIREYCSHGRYV